MKKENQKALPLLALLLAAAAILLVFAAPARAGAKAGLALAENTVLPSLLPLLMLFLMIQNTRAGVLLSRALILPAKALRLPPGCWSAAVWPNRRLSHRRGAHRGIAGPGRDRPPHRPAYAVL